MRLHRKIVLAKELRDYLKGIKGLKVRGGLSQGCPGIVHSFSRDSPGQNTLHLSGLLSLLPLSPFGPSRRTIFSPERRWLHLHVLFWVSSQIALSYLAHIFWKQSLHKLRMGFAQPKTQTPIIAGGAKIKNKNKNKTKNGKERKNRHQNPNSRIYYSQLTRLTRLTQNQKNIQ